MPFLVFEQMAVVLQGEEPEPARAPVEAGCKLEVEEGRAAFGSHKPVRLLVGVVMGDAPAMHGFQQAAGAGEVAGGQGGSVAQGVARQELA